MVASLAARVAARGEVEILGHYAADNASVNSPMFAALRDAFTTPEPLVAAQHHSSMNGTLINTTDTISHAGQKIIEKSYAGLVIFLIVLVVAMVGVLAWFGLRMRGRGEQMLRRSGARRPDCSPGTSPGGSALPAAQSQLVNRSPEPGEAPADPLSRLLFSRFNLLLVFVPLGWLAHWFQWDARATFILNLMAILPLAAITGEATEELASHCGHSLGGFVLASFGNAVELIMMVASLKRGLVELTKATILGSILSNELLILGGAMLYGGLLDRNSSQDFRAASSKEQTFKGSSARILALVSFFAAFCLTMPSIFDMELHTTREHSLLLSRSGCAVVLVGYIVFLIFQLGSHVELMGSTDEEEDDEEISKLPPGQATIVLLTSTVVVSMNSEFLVAAMEDFTKATGLSQHFVGVVVLPVIGNACEHAAAVAVATKNKLDLAINIAIGSTIQISLLGAPFAVVLGWAMNQPMDLSFRGVNTVTMVMSALLVCGTLNTGNTTWLHGFLLVGAYTLLAILYYFLPDKA